MLLNIQTSNADAPETKNSENNKFLKVYITSPEEQKLIQPSTTTFLPPESFICKNLKIKPYDDKTIINIDFFIFCSKNIGNVTVEIEITFDNSKGCSYDKELTTFEISDSSNTDNIIKIHTDQEGFLEKIILNDTDIDKDIVQKIKDIIKKTNSTNSSNLENKIKN